MINNHKDRMKRLRCPLCGSREVMITFVVLGERKAEAVRGAKP